MKIFVCILAVAAIIWCSYSLWHDGYTNGVLEERRKRMRSIAAYNTHITTFRTELSLLQEELDDIKKKLNEKPLTFNHDHTSKPIGKVVNAENSADDLIIHVKEADICES